MMWDVTTHLSLVQLERQQHLLVELFNVQIGNDVDLFRQVVRGHHTQSPIAEFDVDG